MPIGASTSLRRQASSQGRAHMRPRQPGEDIVLAVQLDSCRHSGRRRSARCSARYRCATGRPSCTGYCRRTIARRRCRADSACRMRLRVRREERRVDEGEQADPPACSSTSTSRPWPDDAVAGELAGGHTDLGRIHRAGSDRPGRRRTGTRPAARCLHGSSHKLYIETSYFHALPGKPKWHTRKATNVASAFASIAAQD